MAEEIKFSAFTAADPATLEAAGGIVPSAVAGVGNNKSTWTQIKNWISNPLLALINNMVDKTKPMLQIMIGGLRSVYFSARWFEMAIEDSQPTSVKGAMWYGSEDNLPVVNLDYGVTGSLLDDVITPAINKTGAVIPNGTVCYVSGSQGNRAVVSLAQAVLTPTTQIAVVVATHNVANNALGYFVNRGLVNQLNTSAYTEGQILWVSKTAGQLTGTAPAKPYSQIAVGVVTRVHATVGQIRVFPFPIPRTGQLTDVNTTGIVAGQSLRLNSSGVFEPYTPLKLGETSSTAYRGDRGKVAYDHSQLITGNPHNVTVAQISGLQDVLNGKVDDIDLDEYLPLMGGNLEGDLSIKSNTNSRLLGFIVPIDGYNSSSRNSMSFRHDKNELAHARLKGYTITETGSKIFGDSVDNFFNEKGTFNNLYDSNNPNNDYSIEITPTNQFSNSANTAWRLIVSFHSVAVFSNLIVDIKNGVDIWTTVYNGYPNNTNVFMYDFTLTNGGAIKSVKFTFQNITGNTYINHIGIEGRLSNLESQWYVNRLGGNVYGAINAHNLLVNNKQVATREWTTSQDYITKTISDSLYLESTLKGIPDGIAELDSTGRVPSNQLPSYVAVVESYSSLPTTGENGKIYITIDSNLTYRWNGSGYTEISPSLALGETSSTAYRGDRGKTAYDHSQATGNPHGTDFSELENKPTTLAGYGITDATVKRSVTVSTSAGWYRLGYVDLKVNTYNYVFGEVYYSSASFTGLFSFSAERNTTPNNLSISTFYSISCQNPPSVQWEVLGNGDIRVSWYAYFNASHRAFAMYNINSSSLTNAYTHEYIGATKPVNTELVNCLDRVTLTDASGSGTLPLGDMTQPTAIQWLRNNVKQLQSTAAQNGTITTQDWDSFTSAGVFTVADWSGANGPVINGVPVYPFGQLVVEQYGNTVTQIYYSSQNMQCYRHKWGVGWGGSVWKTSPTDRVTLTDEPAQDVLPSGNMTQPTAIQWLRNNVKQIFSGLSDKVSKSLTIWQTITGPIAFSSKASFPSGADFTQGSELTIQTADGRSNVQKVGPSMGTGNVTARNCLGGGGWPPLGWEWTNGDTTQAMYLSRDGVLSAKIKLQENGVDISSKYAPTNHASASTTYGVATSTNYGHAKLYNALGSATDGAPTQDIVNKKCITIGTGLSDGTKIIYQSISTARQSGNIYFTY